MKLSHWLTHNKVSRAEFARRIGVSAGTITQYCDGTIWPKAERAQRIVTETNGAVTPSDFLEAAE